MVQLLPRVWRELCLLAVRSGARTSVQRTQIEWSISGRCEAPQLLTRQQPWPNKDGSLGRRVELILHVKCRRCVKCLQERAGIWRARARQEILVAPRTWFGTLTLSPQAHYAAQCVAESQARMELVEWNSLDENSRFRRRCVAIAPEVTKWLKRVRKNSGAKFRYCVVVERHKTGLPHFHVLLHEVVNGDPVRHAVLSEAWHLGFSNFKLAKDRHTANYVVKYLTKSAEARVRASRAYGEAEGGLMPIAQLRKRENLTPTLNLLYKLGGS